MAQEFFINSQELEDQVRKLLPSQGGEGAGFDLSASTQIIPIIDLTQSAEGSGLRTDLQSALSHTQITTFQVTNATNTVIITTTGYFRVFGNNFNTGNATGSINLFDGSTSKNIVIYPSVSTGGTIITPFDFIVKITAGDSLRVTSANTNTIINGNTRQLATIDGTLV
tara:strand:- start:1176 stop:1679 length:504 start_codon:yes stop_codon:yes gene_type:complete